MTNSSVEIFDHDSSVLIMCRIWLGELSEKYDWVRYIKCLMSSSSVHSLIVAYFCLSSVPFPIVVIQLSWEIHQILDKPSKTQGIHHIGPLDYMGVE